MVLHDIVAHMPPDDSPPTPISPFSPSSRPHFQFSLQRLLIVVTVIAVLLGVANVFGNVGQWLIWCAIIWVLPVPLVISAIFARGDPRVFSMGALVPWIATWVNGAAPYAILQSSSLRFSAVLMIAIVVGSSGLCGWVAVLSRRWLERHGMTNGK